MLRGVATPTLPQELHAAATRSDDETANSNASISTRTPDWIAAFSDGMGNRRRTDRPMLADMARASPGTTPDLTRLDPEEATWWALHDPRVLDNAGIDLATTGPLFPALRDRGIEWWTQAELSGVHALSTLGLRAKNPAILARVERSATWLLEEVQPDNATQWPWAVHIFAAIAIHASRDQATRTAARHYAQTLVHNAIVNSGAPDPFAACILWSSAAWLELGMQPDARSLALCDGLGPSNA